MNILKLKKIWQRKSNKEKNIIITVIVAIVSSAYLLIQFQFTYEAMKKSDNLYNRQIDRLQKREIKEDLSKYDNSELYSQLKVLKHQIKEAKKVQLSLKKELLPIGDTIEMQSLILDITELGDVNGVDIVSTKNAGVSKSSVADTSLKKYTDNNFRRPLLELNAITTYANLLRFMHEIDKLKYKTTIVRYGVKTKVEKDSITDSVNTFTPSQKALSKPQLLDIELLIAM